jgi:hypothetical protein
MKKAMCMILVVALAATFCGCGRKEGENFTKSGRFTIVSGDNLEAPYCETVIADRETGVIYLVIYVGDHCGITPLLDADGTPLTICKDGERADIRGQKDG